MGLLSTNKDPSILTVPAYVMKSSRVYDVILTVTSANGVNNASTATASAKVFVQNAPITASISGGYSRYSRITSNLTVDASSSVDGNYPPSSSMQIVNLKFFWSCTVASVNSYGSDCSSIFIGPVNGSKVVILGPSLTLDTLYSVKVNVFTLDGRYDTKTVVP